MTPSVRGEARDCPRLMISGLRGGSGKTFLTIGLIAELRSRGLAVAPFKKGPDYIDPAWLGEAAGRPCRNLDAYLMSSDVIRRSVAESSVGADLVIVEANHGFHDGLGANAEGSSAELARELQTPVILVVDCTRATRTVAAMVLGCQKMDPDAPIAGVILNRTGTKRQEHAIRGAVEQVCGVPVLGCVPKIHDLALPERHLGLLTPAEHPERERPTEAAREAVAKHVDVVTVMDLAQKAPELRWSRAAQAEGHAWATTSVRIGVIRDSAFTFYYPENLEALERAGAHLVFLDSMADRQLPPIDALYIGGGYPETHAAALENNTGFRASIRRAVESGMPVFAECGGLIYLAESLVVDGVAHAMTGVVPVTFELGKRPMGHGYACVVADRANPYFPIGAVIRGHEFRYSFVRSAESELIRTAFRVERGYGFDGERDGLVYRNVLASFLHIHALGCPEWAETLVRTALAFRRRSSGTAGMGCIEGACRHDLAGLHARAL
ncbi:MAG: cobyrinate a,c-diamide synthase [Acidobacteriota bacterium]